VNADAADADADADARGLVVLVHGGQSVSVARTSPLQLSVLRMIPLALAVRQGVRGTAIAVRRPRLRIRGWNGAQASPVADLTRWLDETLARLEAMPVVLIGHSMGARAALRVAGHPQVRAVGGLAPWLPPGEPVAQLAGRRVLLAHSGSDTVTSPAQTWAYARRAGAVTRVTTIEVRGGDHAMLRRAPMWHRIAVQFARTSLGLPAAPGPLADIVMAADHGAHRATV
jgi:pimeloyl-ACP methyl ester carboxylesterase